MRFTVYGKPQGKARARTVRNNGKVHSFTPKKTVEYEEKIKWAYIQAYSPLTCFNALTPLSIQIAAFYEAPLSYTKNKKKRCYDGEISPTTKPDADNIAKCVCDALNGIAYKDDSAIVMLQVRKAYGEPARVEIEIREA
jgi:Holliday junction resolvase RusA-like endonuclease